MPAKNNLNRDLTAAVVKGLRGSVKEMIEPKGVVSRSDISEGKGENGSFFTVFTLVKISLALGVTFFVTEKVARSADFLYETIMKKLGNFFMFNDYNSVPNKEAPAQSESTNNSVPNKEAPAQSESTNIIKNDLNGVEDIALSGEFSDTPQVDH